LPPDTGERANRFSHPIIRLLMEVANARVLLSLLLST
jgi:hypothetical protein